MEPTQNDTPAWQQPAGDEPDTAARPALATLTKNGLVKLKLVPYQEAVVVVTSLTQEVGDYVKRGRHLTPDMAESWASLALLHDTWEYQLAPLQRRPPDTVTLTLSRCEALTMWKLWQYMPLAPHNAPGWTQAMDELHKLLG